MKINELIDQLKVLQADGVVDIYIEDGNYNELHIQDLLVTDVRNLKGEMVSKEVVMWVEGKSMRRGD